MQTKPLISTPQDQQPAMNVIGTRVTVLASREDTNGQEVTLQSGEEGMGPPPHSHDWDESFYVLKGRVAFNCAGETLMCEAGTLVHVPAGTVHGFSYGPGGGEMLEFTGQTSHAAQMFRDLSREIPPGPPDIPRVVEVLNRNGVTVHM